VAHGVDFGHSFYPYDIKSPEPIHWSCNEETHREALAYKPSLLLPHPWIMSVAKKELPVGSGTLIVGPPPGPVNDERLYRLVEKLLDGDCSILVKARGAYQASFRFWEERGIKPVTAGAPDGHFYARLAQLLCQHRRIVSGTFSSALIFAASVERQVELLRGFVHRSLEARAYETEVNWASSRARGVVATFAGGDQAAIRRVSRQLLGADLEFDESTKLAELYRLIEKLKGPFWMDPDVASPSPWIRRALAALFQKPGLTNAGIGAYINRLRRRELAIMTVDEVDVWLTGKTPSNFDLQPVVTGRQDAAAGFAAEGYA